MQQASTNQLATFSDFVESPYKMDLTAQSFKNIAPWWPLRNLIAVNPLQGFEDLPIEQALNIAASYFEQKNIPMKMIEINRETIKWLQTYFDDGQATIGMPFRKEGLYSAWRKLAVYDVKLHKNNKQKQAFLQLLPKTSKEAIAECLLRLGIPKKRISTFLNTDANHITRLGKLYQISYRMGRVKQLFI